MPSPILMQLAMPSFKVWIAASLLLPLSLCAFGCSLGTSFSSSHELLNTTRDVRRTPSPNAPIPRELTKSVHFPYVIEPGDELLVEPSSFDSPLRFPSDQLVLSDGTIDLGKYGRIIVAGFSVEQIEQIVLSIVREQEPEEEIADDDINVRLIDPDSKVYYVLGEVNAPGSYPLIGRETVLDAVMRAGGLTQSADPCRVVLARPTAPTSCRVVLSICFNEIVQLGDTATNYQIMPGDRIYIATRPWWASFIPGFRRRGCDFCCNRQVPCADPRANNPAPIYILPARPAENIDPPPPQPPVPTTTFLEQAGRQR